MARIRNVKPEFFIDPELQDLERANPGKYVMMTYEGLWTQSSKNGVFLWEPRILKLYILPFLPYEISDTLDILYKAGFLKKFQHDGKKYGYVPTFNKHQTISGQEVKQPSKYPDYVEGSDWEVTSDFQVPIEGSDREGKGQADLGLRTLDLGLRTKDVGKPQAATPPKKSKAFVPPTLLEVGEYCRANGYDVDPQKFVDFYTASSPPWHDSRGAPVKNWKQKVITWAGRDKPHKEYSGAMLDIREC